MIEVAFKNIFDHSGGKEMAMPGEDLKINLKLNKQMTLAPNQGFTIRGGGKTLGSGKVRKFLN